jgi:hypothetical protein
MTLKLSLSKVRVTELTTLKSKSRHHAQEANAKQLSAQNASLRTDNGCIT